MVTYTSSPSAAFFSFTCFASFALYAACIGFSYHVLINDREKICEDHGVECGIFEVDGQNDEYYETQSILAFTVAAILGLTSVFYCIYHCIESYCMLLLRIIGNVCAMLIFLGASCGVLSKDGKIDTNAVRDYSFSTASDWGSTVAFAIAWIAISAFEINEFALASSRIHVRLLIKAMVFLFWALLAVSTCVSGEKLLNDFELEATDAESVYSKLLLATAGASALAAIMFALFSMCEVGEFAKLHMLAGGLTGILFVAAVGYQSYHYREDLNEWEKDIADGKNEATIAFWEDYVDYLMKFHNIHVAGDVFLGLAIFMSIGFDWLFLSSAGVADFDFKPRSNVSQPKGATTIQITTN